MDVKEVCGLWSVLSVLVVCTRKFLQVKERGVLKFLGTGESSPGPLRSYYSTRPVVV